MLSVDAEIKPCPFCGGETTVGHWEVGDFGDKEAGVECKKCFAKISQEIGYDPEPDAIVKTIKKAIKKWNRRAPI